MTVNLAKLYFIDGMNIETLKANLKAAIKEQKGLEAEIDHMKEKAPLEREFAIKSELKKINNSISLEFGTISKFMNSSANENFPPNVKSCWNIFEKEIKRIFENI